MSTDALDPSAILAILAANLPMVGYLYVGEARTLVYVGAQVELLIGCSRATLLAGELPLSNFLHRVSHAARRWFVALGRGSWQRCV
jgi:hypothetical protein